MPTDVNMMQGDMGAGMGNSWNTPTREQSYSRWLCFVFCEFFFHIIWPVVYGLYLFGVLGAQNEPQLDCYADRYNPEAVPGLMANMDEGTQLTNVSHQFRATLMFLFVSTLFIVVILVPLKLFFGMREFSRHDEPWDPAWQA